MKVLIIAQQPRKFISTSLYNGIAKYCDACDTRYLTKQQSVNLNNYFKKNVDVNAYHRIIIAIRLKRAQQQIKFVSTIPNLAFHETDAFQNYIECKYQGKFSEYYRKLPWTRIISTGATTTERLQQEGFDAVFVPKGYDQQLCKNQLRERTIELAFVGSVNNPIYRGRRELLAQIAAATSLTICQTNPGREYIDKLNDIRIFVTADMGMHEYMIKNFEAMACGCVLFAYDQGELENQAIGFRDMENIVLFTSVEEFLRKLKILREQPALVEKIAAAGQAFVEQNYTFDAIGEKVVAALRPELRQPPPKLSLLSKLRRHFFSA